LQHQAGVSPVQSYRAIVVAYAAFGALMAILFARLTAAAEVPSGRGSGGRAAAGQWSGLGTAGPGVLRLSALFALDSFGGGFVVQSFAAYWFHLRYGIDPATLGVIFFSAHLLAGASALVAARLAARFGLINTMVATHLPSNVCLLLVPLM